MSLTFCILKPDVVQKSQIGEIIHMIEEAGFCIKQMNMLTMDDNVAKAFYCEHNTKVFFNDLVKFMTSGPVVIMCLHHSSREAFSEFRDLIGHTDPTKACSGSIRQKYGVSIDSNAIHGSDSEKSAYREIHFFFGLENL